MSVIHVFTHNIAALCIIKRSTKIFHTFFNHHKLYNEHRNAVIKTMQCTYINMQNLLTCEHWGRILETLPSRCASASINVFMSQSNSENVPIKVQPVANIRIKISFFGYHHLKLYIRNSSFICSSMHRIIKLNTS